MENKITPELKEAFEKIMLSTHCAKDYEYEMGIMHAAYTIGSGLWISIAIKQPEIGRDIWVWHLVMNCETIITYEDEGDLQWFKYWRPVVLLGNPENTLTTTPKGV